MDNKKDTDSAKSPSASPKPNTEPKAKKPRRRGWLYAALASVGVEVVVIFTMMSGAIFPEIFSAEKLKDHVTVLGPVTGVHYLSIIDFETQVDTPNRSVLLRGVFNVENGAVLEIHSNSSESRICEVGTDRCAHWYGAHD